MMTLAASDAVLVVGVTLVNFLWQATLIGLVTAAVLAACPRATATTRYTLACAGLFVMAATPLVSLLMLAQGTTGAVAAPGTSAVPVQAATVFVGSAPTAGLTAWLPGVVSAWSLGVAVLTARLARDWWLAERMRRRDVRAASDALEVATRRLAGRLGVRRRVDIVESPWIDVPAVIGWLRPTILLPIGAFTGLAWQQIEALLAHELAHVRRHDHLVNALQGVVETLFFFHPAVWWLSRTVRIEREHCCDDVAVAACGSALQYARALATLEDVRQQHASMALAATDGSLVARVGRLVGRGPTGNRARPVPIAACVVVVMAAVSFASIQARTTIQAQTPAVMSDRDLALAQQPAPAPPRPVAVPDAPTVAPTPTTPPPAPRPLRVGGAIRPPRKILDVAPVYPEAARAAGIQGVVILEATIDPEGTVSNLRVLRSVPDLDQAAINAVRQWRYDPVLLNGQPVAVIMTATVHFRLTPNTRTTVQFAGDDGFPNGTTPPETAVAGRVGVRQEHDDLTSGRTSRVGTVRVGGDIREPLKTHSVPPVYPADARASNVSGMVVLEATSDPGGNVTDVMVLRSVPMLDQAAIDAVRQWKYTPTLLNGAPVSVLMTVTVNFTLY